MALDVSLCPRAFQRMTALSALCVLALAATSCGDRRDAFIGARVEDTCDGTWPVCDSFAGCLIGEQSYIEGRFPNKGRFVVRVPEPSVVKIHVYLEELGAAGEQTSFTFFEDRCRSRTRLEATGKSFIAEAERSGAFTREATTSGIGDHLIEFDSDAQARYVIKVDVRPTRLREDEGL